MNPSNQYVENGGAPTRVASLSVTSPPASSIERNLQNALASPAGVNVEDVTKMVQHEARVKTEYQRMKWLLGWVSLMLCAMAVVGSIAAKNLLDSTQSTKTEEDGTMVSADGEFVIATALATKKAPLSSFLRDEALRELKVLSVRNSKGASVHLNILGFVRLPKQQYRNSLVKLFTAPGVLLLDGEKLTFDSDVTSVFKEAGFEPVVNMNNVDGAPGRHLLAGLTDLIGMFNFVGKLTDDSTFRAEEQPPHGVATGQTWTAMPSKFKLSATGYTQCLMPRMTVEEQEKWCKAHGAVPHPSAAADSTEKTIHGQFFTRTLTLSQDQELGRSVVTQTVAWDSLQRQDVQVEDAQTGVIKSASIGVDGRLHSCAVGQLPAHASIFDNARASSAHVMDIDGTDVFAVSVDTYVNGLKLEDGKVAMDIQLRIWQSKDDGAWTRFQVYDRQNYGTAKNIVGGTTWTAQTFYDVHTMEPVVHFAPDTFNLAFTGTDADCEADSKKLPVIDEHPSSPVSFAYLAWESEHESEEKLAAVNAMREEVTLTENEFQHIHSNDPVESDSSAWTRRLLSSNVDRTQLLSSVKSYVAEGDVDTANELADGIQHTIDTAVANALAEARAIEAENALPPARMPRALRTAPSRALLAKGKAKCYQFPPKGTDRLLGIVGLEFKFCHGPSLKVDAMLKWKVKAPNVPVLGVSTHARIDALYKNNGLTTLGDFSGGGCVKFTIGAHALPGIVVRGCRWLDYTCSFDLAEICVKYDSPSNSITGTGSIGPKQLQATFKLNVPVRKNAVNKLLGYVKGDIGFGLSFTEQIVDKEF